jgi:purine nucleoside phosphorylase
MKYVEESAAYLLERTKQRPKIGIICGSGLGKVKESMRLGLGWNYKRIRFRLCIYEDYLSLNH